MGYRVYFEDGNYHAFQHREQALGYYKMFGGCKVVGYVGYVNGQPISNEFINKSNVDIRLVRKEEDIVNKTSIAMQKAIRKYDDNNTIQVKLKLNSKNDKDIIDYLNLCGNKQGIIKELIRKQIKENQK